MYVCGKRECSKRANRTAILNEAMINDHTRNVTSSRGKKRNRAAAAGKGVDMVMCHAVARLYHTEDCFPNAFTLRPAPLPAALGSESELHDTRVQYKHTYIHATQPTDWQHSN